MTHLLLITSPNQPGLMFAVTGLLYHSQSPRDLARAGRDVEKITLARALRLVLNKQVFIHHNKTVSFD